MNYIDVLLILILILFTYSGWRKGFIIGTIEMISWLGSFLLSLYFFQNTALVLQKFKFPSELWLYPISFIITLVISGLLINLFFNRLLQKLPENIHFTPLNKFLGVFPGFVTGLIYTTLFALLLVSYPTFEKLSSDLKESVYARRLPENASWIESKFSTAFKPLSEKFKRNLTISPKHTEVVSLPYTVKEPKVRHDLEMEMLKLVNAERTKVGLNALKNDPELTLVARKHSLDMFARGYFSHYTPEKKSPFDRIRRDNVSFLTAGENLALAPNLREAHIGLMNSPGHKANILHKSFGRLGIGILDGGIYGIMVTQLFRN